MPKSYEDKTYLSSSPWANNNGLRALAVYAFGSLFAHSAVADVFDVAPDLANREVSPINFNINSIEPNGNTVVSDQRLDAVLASFVGMPISLERLDNIRATIFDEYSNRGYLCRISIPAQDLSDGSIEVVIEEVTLGEVIVSADENIRFSVDRAESFLRHSIDAAAPLQISKLDDRSKLLDEFYGIAAEAKILPLGESSAVDVRLILDNTDFIATTLQADNLGAVSTGAERLSADFQINSPFHMGERVVFGLIHTEGVDTQNLEFEFPFGAQGSSLAFGINGSSYTVNEPDFTVIGSSSRKWIRLNLPDTEIFGLPARREVGVESSSSVDDIVVFGVSSPSQDKTTIRVFGTTSLSWQAPESNWALNVSSKLTFGILDLSKIQSVFDGDQIGAQTDGEFAKFNLDIAGQYRLNENTSITVSASCQLARKNLSSDDEIELSGPTGVRSYSIGSVNVDQGCYAQNELIRQFSDNFAGYLFSDLAYGQTNKSLYDDWQTDDEANQFGIMSAGLGVRLALSEGVNFSLSYAQRIGNCQGCYSHQSDGQFWAVMTGTF